MRPTAKEKTPMQTLPLPSHVAAPVARVGDRVVWECPRCHHQFCADFSRPEAGSPLVTWLGQHIQCGFTALPKGEDSEIERAAITALAELEGEGH